jgi:hypothetical protein
LEIGDAGFEALEKMGMFSAAREHLRVPTPRPGRMNVIGPNPPTGFASPYDFEPTDMPGAGIIGLRRIAVIRRSMRLDGYDGPPVSVVVHEGTKYVLNGNQRVRAAEGIVEKIPYRVVRLPFLGYDTMADVFDGWQRSLRLLPEWTARRARIRSGG